jgi:RecA-family ATPase
MVVDERLARRARQIVQAAGNQTVQAVDTGIVPPLALHNAAEIDAQEIKPPKFVIDRILPVGGAILGAKPKIGKTYMAIDWGLAVASGGKAIGSLQCDQGDALLLLMEDNVARAQTRMRQIMGEAPKPPALSIAFQDENSRRIDTGLLDQIEQWAGAASRPRLVVVDTLTAVRPTGLDKRGVFQVEYEMVRPFNDLAHKLGVALVVVHHLRKQKSTDDPIDELSGTLGLAAGIDTLMGLRRNGSGFELLGRGRDVEEFEFGLARGAGRWTLLGSAEEVRMTGERQRAFVALRELAGKGDGWVSAKTLAEAVGKETDAMRKMLDRMCKDGDGVERQPGHGLYRAARQQAEMMRSDDQPF